MDPYGLALCGGGAKGAFHIGMWKAMDELDFTKNIVAVSGTSAGALNAVLFALGNYKRAETIWKSVQKETFLSSGQKGNALFSREGLNYILDSVDLSRLRMPVYVNILNAQRKQVETYLLNNLSNIRKRELLLASSALPVVYDQVLIDGRKYMDGGINHFGNVPIEPLYLNGYHNILIASLSHKFNLYDLHDAIAFDTPHTKIDITNQYPECRFKCIVPSKELGGFLKGTINFNQAFIHEAINQGYIDTQKKLTDKKAYFMKHDYATINIEIEHRMRELFKNSREIEYFIKTTNFSNANLEMVTMGGTVWYSNIVELYGWKLQQHKLPTMKGHYRFLDSNNIRRAWVLDPEDILLALDKYESYIKMK